MFIKFGLYFDTRLNNVKPKLTVYNRSCSLSVTHKADGRVSNLESLYGFIFEVCFVKLFFIINTMSEAEVDRVIDEVNRGE